MVKDTYESPLSARYASKEMKYIFSPDKKFRTWRKLWIALAESEKELGLPITQEQIDELKAHADDINYEVAQEREKIVRHDVMSHVYAYGVQCPNAKGIIHLGANLHSHSVTAVTMIMPMITHLQAESPKDAVSMILPKFSFQRTAKRAEEDTSN